MTSTQSSLIQVPTDAWYCSACLERQAKRENRNGHQIDNIDQWRNKPEEDRLVNEYVDSKIPELAKPFEEGSQLQCMYCGLTEFEVCSPFVIGQSRQEHEEWVNASSRAPVATNVISSGTCSNVNFFFLGSKIIAPKVTSPNFPLKNSEEGVKLMSMYEAFGRSPVVVHQLCALQMFQARMNRTR